MSETKKTDESRFNDTLKRMLKTPPRPHVPEKDEKAKKPERKKDDPKGDKRAEALLSDIRRLRGDVAFLACVTRQFRDVAVATHIAARRNG